MNPPTDTAHQENYWDQASVTKGFSHPIDLVKFKTLVKPNDRILDYGCGQGRLCGELAEAGFTNITGLDYSAGMIDQARSRYPNLDFVKADGYTLPYESQSFDVILLFAVLTCIPSDEYQKRLIAEITRVLRIDGVLLISDYLLQSDERNVARYNQFKEEFQSYGVFRLGDGGIVRHHHESWFSLLLKDYSKIQTIDMDAKTMNGNPARIHQIWAKRSKV